MIAAIIVIMSCIVLAFGAVVLLILNQFKDEPPTYWDWLQDNNKRFWFKKDKK